MGRPILVYREGGEEIGGGDFVPGWLEEWCVHRDLCQCNLAGKPVGVIQGSLNIKVGIIPANFTVM